MKLAGLRCDACGRSISDVQTIAVLRSEDGTWWTVTHAGDCTLRMLAHLAAAHGMTVAS